MIPRQQFILGLNNEKKVDGFAGGGGASTGIDLALGCHVDDAFNHSPRALGMHRINHPQTVHHCEDVFDVVPEAIAERRRVGLGWFSPDCKHFSKAKGGKPLDKTIRGLAFSIFRWARIRTRVIYMENVEEIQTWGPLLHHPKHRADCACGKPCGKADPAYRGRTWRAFLAVLGAGIDPDHPDIPEMLEVLLDRKHPDNTITKEQLVRGFGYDVEFRELRACDYGAPTIRKRLFMIARCDAMPIVWPEPTHAPADRSRALKLKPYRTVAECIDWDIACPSIFLTRKQARTARCRRPLAKSTLRRIATGMDRYVLKAKKPFLVSLTHQGGDNRVESVDDPMSTITAAHRGEKALVTPFVTEHANASSQRNVPADKPLPTQCAEVKGGHFALVSPSLMVNTTHHTGAPIDQPAPTIPTGGHHALISGALVRPAHGDQDKNGKRRGRGASALTEQLPTQTASNEFALAACHMVQKGHLKSNSKMVKGADEPMRCQTTRGEHALVAANMVKLRGDAKTHAPGSEMKDPAHTSSAGGQHHSLVTSNMVSFYSGKSDVGQKADSPMRTQLTKEKIGVVSGSLAAYYGSEEDGQPLDESLRTISTKPRFGLALSEAVAPPMLPEHVAGARRVAKFLRSFGVEFEGEFATVGGFVIVDIGMRMLTPRELFRAQGFPEEYVIDRAWVIDAKTGELVEVYLTKEQQIRMCGNSVCPPVARALVLANSPELCIGDRKQVTQPQREAVAA